MAADVHPQMPSPHVTGFSTDGFWWWNGQGWLPTYSPDRLWRFDGKRWVPARGRGKPPRWLVVSGAVWLIALASWLLFGAVALGLAAPGDVSRPEVYVLLGLAAVAVLVTCGWGFLLGRRRALKWLWPAAAVGTVVQMFCYVVGMVAAPAPDGSDQDTAAAVGIVILTIPTAVILLTLLWFGAGLGVLSRGSEQR